MREFAKKLYKSKAWQSCRNGYLKSKGGLCENCLKKGLIVPAEIVHHKVHLSEENIDDESITLNYENLEALCRQCHGLEHQAGFCGGRYKVNKLTGEVTIL